MIDKKIMTVQEAFDSLTQYYESIERTIDTLCDHIENLEERLGTQEKNVANISNFHFMAHGELEARIKKLEGNIKKPPVSESGKNNQVPLFKCLNCGKMVSDLSSHKGMRGYAC